jgi:hypothetical protein
MWRFLRIPFFPKTQRIFKYGDTDMTYSVNIAELKTQFQELGIRLHGTPDFLVSGIKVVPFSQERGLALSSAFSINAVGQQGQEASLAFVSGNADKAVAVLEQAYGLTH